MYTEPAVAGERHAWPWIAALTICFALLGALIVLSMQRCEWHFGYPMDDTYIHMAMAKNFSLHGVWGTTRYGFTSSTSSPFYTLILAGCYLATGVHEITPLILNLLAGAALLAWCNFVFTRANLQARLRFYLLAFLVFAIPLPILVIGGMEHTLHMLLTLVFVHLCCVLLTSRTDRLYEDRLLNIGFLLILSAVLVMTRYEAAFLIAAAGVMFLVRGKWNITLALGVTSALPICAYGAVSMMHGWLPLPTSLLLKANLPSAAWSGIYPGFLVALSRNVSRGSHVVVLAVIAGALIYRTYKVRNTIWTYGAVGTILFVATAALHLTLARTGWFFRYEAYLVAFGIVFTALLLFDVGLPRPRKVSIAALAILACLVTGRTGYAFYVAPQAISDIYDQQYQMGLFVQHSLGERTILLHDIGAVSFLSDARVLDLVGLGSLDSAMARMRHEYSTAWLERWAETNHASAAIVYSFVAPREWQPVTTWTIPGNYMSGSDAVSFFALDPAFRQELREDLERFKPKLPKRVVVKE